MYTSHELENLNIEKKKKIFIWQFFVCYFLISSSYYGLSQNTKIEEKEVIAIAAGIGSLTFYGDVGEPAIASRYSFMRTGIFFSSKEKLKKTSLFL